jgi:hypothetical protein
MIRSLVHSVEEQIREIVAATQSPIAPHDIVTTGATLSTAGRLYARYIGRRAKTTREVDISIYTSVAGTDSGSGWAEFAVATGTIEDFDGYASTPLTIRGYADCKAAMVAGAGWKEGTVSGLAIAPGTDMWAVWANNLSTTQVTYRRIEGGNTVRLVDGTRPSLSVDVAQNFTTNAELSIPALMAYFR